MRNFISGIVFKGILICFAVVLFLVPIASPNPDGLERVAKDKDFDKNARVPLVTALLPDYSVPWLKDTKLSSIVSGGAGVLITFGLVYLVGKAVSKPKKQD